MTNIGLLGCGAIGSEVAEAICNGKVGTATLVAIYDRCPERALALAGEINGSPPYFTNFDRFLASPGLEMVVECASPEAIKAHAEHVIYSNKDLLMISSGALTDMNFFQRLADLTQARGRRLIIPSGALGGIDALRAVRGHLDEVTLTTIKTPRSLEGALGFRDWESRKITKPQVIFDGSALEAIKLFPANVNVGATLSLAGLGPLETRVKVIADPQSPGNVHQIYARGDFGVMRFTLENRPHEKNPRTSYLAVLSVLETLRAACTDGPRIGT